MSLNDWEEGTEVPADKEGEYLKDLCAALREQQALSPARKEGESQVCDVVPDDLAAHAADIIEELWERLDEEYKEGIAKGMEIKMDEFAYEISKGVVGRAAGK
jgi:hypothetical protein